MNQRCLKASIAICEGNQDFVSREVFEDILTDTEEHIGWLEEHHTRIEQVGLQNYLQEHMLEGETF